MVFLPHSPLLVQGHVEPGVWIHCEGLDILKMDGKPLSPGYQKGSGPLLAQYCGTMRRYSLSYLSGPHNLPCEQQP